MKELLDTVLFDRYTVGYLLFLTGIAFVLLVVMRMILGMFSKQTGREHFQSAACSSCGWHGKVSRYAGRCPKCNQPLGERKAHPKP